MVEHNLTSGPVRVAVLNRQDPPLAFKNPQESYSNGMRLGNHVVAGIS